MTAPSIVLDGVAKGYRFYQRPMDRLRELLGGKPRHQLHWALQAISLQVLPGETFGLVGENGAGKSTLLKLVAGTVRASQGRVAVNGRVAALLELGAGFHPEESGRENVYLMGALAGIPPGRMVEHYEAIAEFSELPAEALARPVKTYSSGMFMRLAFAVATAVDPDILIIDEALSVGDMHFQKKSLDRIMSFRERGKTVLFCSHNLYQIRSLCARTAWLHEGRLRALGLTEEVVTAYESYEREKEAALSPAREQSSTYRAAPTGSAPVRVLEVNIGAASGDLLATLEPAMVTVRVESRAAGIPFHVGVAVVRNDRENVFGTSTHFGAGEPVLGAGEHRLQLALEPLSLLSGDYWLSVYVLDDSGLQVYDMAESVCPFTVHSPGQEFGVVYIPHRWVRGQ